MGENKNLPCIRESILLNEKFITGYAAEEEHNGNFRESALKRQKPFIKILYRGLIYPIKIVS